MNKSEADIAHEIALKRKWDVMHTPEGWMVHWSAIHKGYPPEGKMYWETPAKAYIEGERWYRDSVEGKPLDDVADLVAQIADPPPVDIFLRLFQGMLLSEPQLQIFVTCRNKYEESLKATPTQIDISQKRVDQHIRFLEDCLKEISAGSWEYAYRLTLEIKKVCSILNEKEQQEVEALCQKFRDKYNIPSTGEQCVSCGVYMEPKQEHKCKKRDIIRQRRMKKKPKRTDSQRLSEGYNMMEGGK